MEAIGTFLNTTISVALMLGGLFVMLLVGYAKGFNSGKQVGFTAGFYKGRAAERADKDKAAKMLDRRGKLVK